MSTQNKEANRFSCESYLELMRKMKQNQYVNEKLIAKGLFTENHKCENLSGGRTQASFITKSTSNDTSLHLDGGWEHHEKTTTATVTIKFSPAAKFFQDGMKLKITDPDAQVTQGPEKETNEYFMTPN